MTTWPSWTVFAVVIAICVGIIAVDARNYVRSHGRHHKAPNKWWMEDWRAYPDLLELAGENMEGKR